MKTNLQVDFSASIGSAEMRGVFAQNASRLSAVNGKYEMKGVLMKVQSLLYLAVAMPLMFSAGIARADDPTLVPST